MSRFPDQNTEIHDCTFQAHISQIQLNIRFPCRIFVAWKAPHNKILVKTQNQNLLVQNNTVNINETLTIQSKLLYDPANKKYLQKQTTLNVFLISKRKPNEENLVGRIVVDLAECINDNPFLSPQFRELGFCSIKDSSINFRIEVKGKRKTNLKKSDLEADEFSLASIPGKNQSFSISNGNQDIVSFKKQPIQQPKFEVRNFDDDQVRKLSEENLKLVEIINKSNEEIKRLKMQMQRAQQAFSSQMEGNKKIQQIEEEKNTIVEELIKQINEERQEKLNLKEQMKRNLDQLQAQMKEFEQKYSESNQSLIIHENQILSSKQQLSILEGEKNKLEAHISQKDGKIELLKKEIKEIKSQHEQQLKETKQALLLRNKVEELEKSNRKLEEINKNQKEELGKKQKEVLKRFNEEIEKLQKELIVKEKKYEKELKSIESKIKQKQESLKQNKTLTEQLNTQIESEIQKNQKYQEFLVKFSEREAKLKDSILILEQESKKIFQIVIQKEENEEIQNELNINLEKENKSLWEDLHKERENISLKNQQIRQLKRKMYDFKKEIIIQAKVEDQISSEFNKSSKLNDLNKERVEELESELKNQEKQFCQNLNKLTLQIEELKEERKKQEGEKIALLEKEKAKFKKEITEREKKIKQLQSANIQLEKSLSQLNFSLQKERETYVSLEKDHKKAKDELKGYEDRLSEQKNMINGYIQKIQDFQTSRIVSEGSNKSVEFNFPEYSKKQSFGHELMKENEILKKNISNSQQTNKKLKAHIGCLEKELRQYKCESEQSDMRSINAQLSRQFDKKTIMKPNILKKSSSLSKNHLALICRDIKEVLKQRSVKQKTESMVELLIQKNSVLETNISKVSEERGPIQETARKLSMQFQKIKSKIFKGKGEYSEKKDYLDSLKPCEGIVKELIYLSENLSEIQFEQF